MDSTWSTLFTLYHKWPVPTKSLKEKNYHPAMLPSAAKLLSPSGSDMTLITRLLHARPSLGAPT